jgi:3D-(3,5/4)-trihydroxycyclohexane-1,2-dione acylhydrolase (decyclizing)
VVLDNRGFGCINRLQQATAARRSTICLRDARHQTLPEIDFAAHARQPVVTDAGGHWWDVATPEVSQRATVNTARRDYETALGAQRLGD